MKEAVEGEASLEVGTSTAPLPSLGVDLDGCCDEHNLFFQTLTRVWPGPVFVLTFRHDLKKAEDDLRRLNIKYDELILVGSFAAKAQVIHEKGILVYFDDQPEMLQDVDAMRSVMLVRNEGNFDFDDKKWMLSDRTGKIM